MSRRAGREIAVRALFQIDLAGVGTEAALSFAENGFPDGDAVAFARTLLAGTLEHLAEIDRLLEQTAKEWSLERMPATDRNILRVAVYEILYGDTPEPAAINEAVTLAKAYGTEDSGRFVNGVLAGILLRRGEAR